MCGRFTLRKPHAHPWINLGTEDEASLARPRYNIAPSHKVLVVDRGSEGKYVVHPAAWGFRPHWLPTGRKAPINARAESVAEKPMFRGAFRKHRCLVPADGWYEWQARDKGRKQPYFFHRPDDGVFWFAGLGATDVAGEPTMAILTTTANSVAQSVHGRMPVVLADNEAAEAWLDPDAADSTLRDLLAPAPNELIETYPIAQTVNKPENDGPELIYLA